MKRVDILDADESGVGFFVLLVEDVVKHVGKEKIAVVLGSGSERRIAIYMKFFDIDDVGILSFLRRIGHGKNLTAAGSKSQ